MEMDRMEMDQMLRPGTRLLEPLDTDQLLRLETGQLQEAGLPQAKESLWEMAGKEKNRERRGKQHRGLCRSDAIAASAFSDRMKNREKQYEHHHNTLAGLENRP